MFINFAQPFSLPPYWLDHPEVVKSIDDISQMETADALNMPCACPLKIKWESESTWWQLPIEPVVAIGCKNNITKRSVLKAGYADVERRGTVKELWSQDDYDISISGVFMSDSDGTLPETALRRLRAYCEGRKSVEVESPLFTLFNIRRMAIEDYQFPFTKGMENQMYTIKATSDDFDDKKLLIV